MTSEDEYKDAHAVAQEAMEASEAPQKDVEPEVADSESKEDVQEEETETGDNLSDAQLDAAKKFGKLSGDKQVEKIQSMLGSGRDDQVEKAKELQELFDVELSTTASPDIDNAIAAALKKAGLDQTTIEEIKENKEKETQKVSASVWAKALGVKADDILKNKVFVKAYHQSGEENVARRVDEAVKVFAATRSFPNPDKAEATQNLSTTGDGTEAQVVKKDGYVDMKEMLSGKTLDEINLSTI